MGEIRFRCHGYDVRRFLRVFVLRFIQIAGNAFGLRFFWRALSGLARFAERCQAQGGNQG